MLLGHFNGSSIVFILQITPISAITEFNVPNWHGNIDSYCNFNIDGKGLTKAASGPMHDGSIKCI